MVDKMDSFSPFPIDEGLEDFESYVELKKLNNKSHFEKMKAIVIEDCSTPKFTKESEESG